MNDYEVVVPIADVRQMKAFLQASATLHEAEDIMRAQRAMRELRPAPLGIEAQRLLERINHILGSHLLEMEEQKAAEVERIVEESDIDEDVEPSAMLAGPDLSKVNRRTSTLGSDSEVSGDDPTNR